jgi:hypothetical protein
VRQLPPNQTLETNPAAASLREWKSVQGVLVCLVALIVDLSVLPMFAKATGTFSDSGVPGLVATAIAGTACVCGFLRCPPRPLIGKIASLVLMILGLLIGLHEWLVQAKGILY